MSFVDIFISDALHTRDIDLVIAINPKGGIEAAKVEG
jgi:hypothetical protein